LLDETIAYFANLPFWELTAVITALAYVILAAKENIWCWPAALISTAIYTVIFYDVYLWMESLLQVYYLAMAVFGWLSWRKGTQKNTIEIQTWSLSFHAKSIALLLIISVAIGWLMDNFTPTSFPYIDAATTVFAVFTTYLVTQKVLENWLYWIVIDFVSIYLYLEKGLTPTAALFVVYVVIAGIGYYAWRKKLGFYSESVRV